MHPKIILIHPPVSKPSEAPSGLANLSGCLQANSIKHEVIDMNLEGLLYLSTESKLANGINDSWTVRAWKHRLTNISALREREIYGIPSRYRRAVSDINRLINQAGKADGINLSLADYRDARLTPMKSEDLLQSAEKPELNPFYPYFSSRLAHVLEEDPDFIGISLNYLSQALCTFAIMGFIRKINNRQKIILGGSLVTSWMKIIGDNNIFSGLSDELVSGPGERKLLDLMDCKNGIITAVPCLQNFPVKEYLSPVVILPFATAQGCYWRQCSFCPENTENNRYLAQPASLVTANLQTLENDLHPGLIHFVDNALSPAFLNELIKSGLSIAWYGFARITPHLADDDFCRGLRRSGCAMLKLGIESGDQGVLDALNKGIDLQTVTHALRAIKRAGIATYIYLLFGTPPENEDSALKTLSFITGHRDCIDFLNLAIFNLPAFSEEAQSLSCNDFYEGDLSLYKNFRHPLGWQRSDVRKFLEKTFKKHPVINKIVISNPDCFTSNHAPFFVENSSVGQTHRPSSKFTMT
jgi:hypothetical protein